MVGNKIINRITRIAVFAAILFIQEELLTFLPNIQLTQVLICVYYFSFGFFESLMIVIIHVLLDNIFIGSFSIIYTPAMLFGWISLVLILHLLRNVLKRNFTIGLVVGFHAFLYSWLFILCDYIMYKIDIIPYFIADLPFELILFGVGFVTTWLLREKLVNVLKILKGDRN